MTRAYGSSSGYSGSAMPAPPVFDGAIGGFHELDAAQTLDPGKAGLAILADPAAEVVVLEPEDVIETEIVEAFVMRFVFVKPLPVQIEVIHERFELEAAVPRLSKRLRLPRR